MRLTELNPRWCSHGGQGMTDSKTGAPIPFRDGIGLICDCPKCSDDHPLFVPFANPISGGEPTHPVAWQRTGETFEDLTLAPSILRKDCGWHGFIRNGEIIHA